MPSTVVRTRPHLGPITALAWSVTALPAWGAECTEVALEAAVADTMTAFEAMDAAALTAARARAQATLACVVEPVPSATAAGVHRIEGITAFLARDAAASTRAFHAAASADPDFAFPVSLVPPGHPMHKIYTAAAAMVDGPIEPVQAPAGYALWVDGREAGTRPLDRPAVLQLVTDGRAAWTAYVPSGAPLPEWQVPALAPVVADPGPTGGPEDPSDEPPRSRSRATVPLALAGAGALAASAATYAVAAGNRSRFDDPGTPYEDLEALQGRTNTWMSASIGTGLLGVGLGVTSALTTVRF